MPTDTEARAKSALSGFGLFLTAIVFCYLNSTTTGLMSEIYVSGVIITSLAMAAKWAAWLGVENKLSKASDYLASFVPWVALYFMGVQALHFHHDGIDGFMAPFAMIALVFLGAFGIFESISTLIGSKYKVISDSAAEVNRRLHDIADAASGNSTRPRN